MTNQHAREMEKLSQIIQKQAQAKDQELKKLIIEKNKQIDLIQKSEEERDKVTKTIQEMLERESKLREQQMNRILEAFQAQQAQTANHLRQLPPEYVAELEMQKKEARGEYDRREIAKSRQGGNLGKNLTEPASHNREQSNMEAIIRADRDTMLAAENRGKGLE